MTQHVAIKKVYFLFLINLILIIFYLALRWISNSLSEIAYRCTFSNSDAFANITDVYYEDLCEFQCNQLRNCTHFNYFRNNKLCSLKSGNVTKDDAVYTNSNNYCGIMSKVLIIKLQERN